jgi:hypothetical protein
MQIRSATKRLGRPAAAFRPSWAWSSAFQRQLEPPLRCADAHRRRGGDPHRPRRYRPDGKTPVFHDLRLAEPASYHQLGIEPGGPGSGNPAARLVLEGAVGISWQIHPGVGIDLRWAETRNRSTSDVSRYDVGVGGLTLRIALQF